MSQLAPHRAESRSVLLPHGPVALLDARPEIPPVATALLVPGYTGSKEDFAPLFDPLTAEGVRVVAMDQPGQYESPGPDDPVEYSVGWLGSVVRAVAAGLGDGPVHLLGHSFGGLVARAAAVAEPAAFRSLTLLCSGPAAIGGSRQDRMAALEPYLDDGMEAVYEAVEMLARADPKWQHATPELRIFLRERFVTSSAAGLRGMADALLGEPDRVADLAGSGLPVLVAYGEDDDAWQPATQAEMAHRLGADHVVIPGAAHSPAIENTATTAKTLAAFWLGNPSE